MLTPYGRSDFAERCLYNRDQPVIVWLRVGNTSNKALLRWFMPRLQRSATASRTFSRRR